MKGTRICKICGKEYLYCKSFRPTGMFRWEDVACCPDHAVKYFETIEKSRSENKETVDAEEEVLYIPGDELEEDKEEDSDGWDDEDIEDN